MWKKVLYFGIAIVFAILIYVIGYSSNQMNHLEGIVKSAIEKEEYYKVPMVWEGCFDTTSIIENNEEKLDIVLYPATSQTDVSYGGEDNTSRFLRYERAYYLYIFNTKFSISNVNAGSTSYNQTSISFSGENGNSYEYYFIVNEKMNSQSYVSLPLTKEEALLNASRDVTSTNSAWNFMRITLTETMLEQIKKEINGDITKLEMKDADGKVQYSTNVPLDFSQKFFEDVKPLFENYNTYLDAYLAAGKDKKKIQEAEDTFEEFYEPWMEEFEKNKEQTGYTFRYDDSYLSPGKIIWQTIGMLALYALVIALFYILLFHFSLIKRIFSRETYKDYSKSSGVMVNGKMVERSKSKTARPVSNKIETEVKPDTVADETLETVTAGEVLVASESEPVEPEKPLESNELEPEVQPEPVEETPVEVLEEQATPTESVQEAVVEEVAAEVKEKPAEEPKKAPAKKSTTTKKTSSKNSTKKTTSTTKKKTVEPKETKNEEN